jgi:hypothetical protein
MCQDAVATIVVCRKCYGELAGKGKLHGIGSYVKGCRCQVCTEAGSKRYARYYAENREKILAQKREAQRRRREGL